MPRTVPRKIHKPATLAVLLFLILAAETKKTSGQPPTATISGIYHQAWGVREGVPGSVTSITQTPDGYLWLATSVGLYRFDGVHFERYALPADNRPNAVTRVWSFGDGQLWVAYNGALLSVLKDGQLTDFGKPEGLGLQVIRNLARDREGAMWAAGRNGLARLAGNHWQEIGAEWNVPPSKNSNGALFIDRNGAVWIAPADELLVLRPGSQRFQSVGIKGKFNHITGSADGTIWVASEGRVFPIVPSGTPPIYAHGIPSTVTQLLIDQSSRLWIADAKNGVMRTQGAEPGSRGRITARFTTLDGLTADNIFALFQDREANVWVGTSHGLDLLRETALESGGFPQGIHAARLVADRDGSLWAASQSHKLAHLQNGILSFANLPARTSALYQEPSGTLWAWTIGSSQLWRLDRGRLSAIAGIPKDTVGDSAWSIAKDRTGRLWVGFLQAGLYCFKDGVWSRPSLNWPTKSGRVRVAIDDEVGRVWFGYAENAVAMLDGDRVETYSISEGLQVGTVRALSRSRQRTWVGGRDGVALIAEGRVHMLNGINASSVGTTSGIVEAHDGSLWLNADRGIVQIAAGEVQRLLADPSISPRFRVFDYLDGGIGNSGLLPTQSAISAKDGRLWFVGFDAVVSIDPAKLITNPLPPPVHIQSLRSGDAEYPVSQGLRLPVGTTNLQINYTGLSLTMPTRVHFRYQLEGVDPAWQDVGARREAYYTNLKPGEYTFRVIAANNDGVWNETGATLAFKIAPAFYQTNWFLLACILAVVLAAWAAYRWRMRQIAARLDFQFEQRLSERTRIAQDLHDTLLQGLLSASMQLHVAVDHLPEDSPAKPPFRRVLEIIGQVVEEGRQALQGIRAPHRDALDLEQAFSRISQEFAPHQALENPVGFQLSVLGRSCPLSPIFSKEVYHIGREALINAFRHSQAANIEVEVEYAAKHLRILVRDDGRGITPEVLRSGRDGHWGLLGMRERAESMGARLHVRNRASAGTEVELLVPGKIAYQTPPLSRVQNWLSRLYSRKTARH